MQQIVIIVADRKEENWKSFNISHLIIEQSAWSTLDHAVGAGFLGFSPKRSACETRVIYLMFASERKGEERQWQNVLGFINYYIS